jgi:hypothetical protein
VVDLGVGAPGIDSGEGGVYVVFLNQDGTVKGHTLTLPNSTVFGSRYPSYFGEVLEAPGDVDG